MKAKCWMALGPGRLEKEILMRGASGPATPVTQTCRLPKWLGRGAHLGGGGHSVSVVNIQVDKGRKKGGPGAIEGMFP